jgi:hypothetical protein
MESGQAVEFNFIFSDGSVSKETTTSQLTKTDINPTGRQVKKIEMIYRKSDGILFGLNLYDKDGAVLLKTSAS